MVGGATGSLVAVLTEPLVAGFVALFVQGFAGGGRALLQSLEIDPRLATALGSPGVLVLLISLAGVAPSASMPARRWAPILAAPQNREEAFLFGAWAGVGFALVENLAYAGIGVAAGHQWPMVAVSRSIGAAANPSPPGW